MGCSVIFHADEVAKLVDEERAPSVRVEREVARAGAERRGGEARPGGIRDDLVEPEVHDAVRRAVWRRQRLVAVRLVLSRQVGAGAGMAVRRNLPEAPFRDLHGTRGPAGVVGPDDAPSLLR